MIGTYRTRGFLPSLLLDKMMGHGLSVIIALISREPSLVHPDLILALKPHVCFLSSVWARAPTSTALASR